MNQPTGTELAVCEDIARRQEMGRNKYGVTVAENPLRHREWLQHAYEEALDFAIYLKRAISVNGLQDDVRDFMVKAGQDTPEKPKMPDIAVRKLRAKLIAEELLELCSAYSLTLEISETGVEIKHDPRFEPNLTEAYDAILDLLVVTIGSSVAMGIDLDPGWREVHRSNMSKFIDGHRREDGKWVKGPSYSPANLRPIIEAQEVA